MAHVDLSKKSASELRRAIQARELRAVEVAEAALQCIAERNGQLNAFISVCRQPALEAAAAVDAKVARGEELGILEGVPVAVKDNICTAGHPTTCASRILANFVPPYDSTVVRRLRQAGMVIVGKTNMDEFAMGSSSETSYFGAVHNPWALERITGGSSGGSAAAVAAGCVPLALGSDTGGSIRQPAGMCGVVGLKPTYGRVSRFGLVAFASSLDQIGPLGHHVEDVAALLQIISGHDPHDSTAADLPVEDYTRNLGRGVERLRLGVPKEYFIEGMDADIRAATEAVIQFYVEQGCRRVELSLPHTDYAIAAYYIVASSEASSNLARYDGVRYGYRTQGAGDLYSLYARTRAEGFGSEVKRRIMLGTFALSSGYYDAYYRKAQKVRTLIRQDFERAFAQVDAIICPVSPIPAFPIGEKFDDPLQMYLCDVFTLPASMGGVPGMSIPVGRTRHGLPIGVQLLAPHFKERTLLDLAAFYQRHFPEAFDLVK
ncbi:MAG: Asp-tRNA(Asn)/Glu-tRNA(Gln) amidotransferase subunit GatA [Candidatus Tectomicrobia bacterium]|nr:Asp-tRNA(Asn)/Glu-tRNA(Gln) amidotransferase subunit GatA [Candidatus Tectomicrobia bacterium]